MAGWQNSNRANRLPNNWQALRTTVLRRDNGVCYLCGNAGADTVDHIQPGDDNTLTNLAAVHDRTPPHCHRRKTATEAAAGRARTYAKTRHPAERNPGLVDG